MSKKLKPCPFCGSKAKKHKYHVLGEAIKLAYCPNEDCSFHDRTATIADWNARPVEKSLNKSNAELKKMVAAVQKYYNGAMNEIEELESRIEELGAEYDRLKLAYKQYVRLSNDVKNERDQAQSTIVDLIELAQNMRFRLAVYDDIDPTLAEWSDFLFKLKNDGA
jgi:chromosome segregation ATPase